MVQTILLFIVYLFIFNWLITRIGFFKNTGLNQWWLTGLFTLKIIAGLAYAFFYLQPAYYATSDTWHYFDLSKGETDWLLKDPAAFFKDIFVSGYQQSGGLFAGENSYWNDLKSTLVIKLLAICNVFTFKNYYADIVFFNFFFFFGPVALYKLVKQLFNTNKLLLISCIFLLPSFLFWCSGIHKDGFIFSCTALIAYYFNEQICNRRVNLKPAIISILCFIVLFALRNFMALLLLPALLIWLLCCLYPVRSKIIIASVYGLGILLFFVSPFISTTTNLPEYVIEKQDEFKKLSGTSSIDVPALDNSFTSFVKFFPTAVDIAFFRPHVTEINNKSYIPAAAEVICLWLFAAVSLFIRKKSNKTPEQKAFIFFCICFAVSFLLLAGYTITFSGAIVRYRAVVLPFLFIPVAAGLQFSKGVKHITA